MERERLKMEHTEEGREGERERERDQDQFMVAASA